jgi:hypothetical protein
MLIPVLGRGRRRCGARRKARRARRSRVR